MWRNSFPFSAVIGQDRVKEALLLNIVNPRIGGVLISGQKGTAKSTLVRGVADLTDDMEVIDLPLNITEDRLVGSIDIEAAIKKGKKYFEPGILEKAHGNILYVDEVNLLSEHIVNCLLETAASGVNIIEREGISYAHNSRFILVGTMNPEEGLLRPQIIDRFGLYAEAHEEVDIRRRTEIIKRRLEYEDNPTLYLKHWRQENQKLADRIQQARIKLDKVQVTDEHLSLAADISREACCAGHRAEIITIETAKAIAAFNGRTGIEEADIKEAAGYVLPHRMRDSIPITDSSTDSTYEEKRQEYQETEVLETSTGDTTQYSHENEVDADTIDIPHTEEQGSSNQPVGDSVESPIDIAQLKLMDIQLNENGRHRGSGKRTRVKSDSSQGRYVRYSFPRWKVNDLAFDATLRAAAPHQKSRASEDISIVIKQPDIREKVKEKHTGCVVLFLVDASGSMGARRRMGAVKGAVISLLEDVYQKRDRVGVIAFRKNGASTLLGITRSVDLAQKCLKELPTGGKTPLAAGLEEAYKLLKSSMIKELDMVPYLILVSDGKANIPLMSSNAVDDALTIAEKIRNEGISCMVLDTENGYIRLEFAKKISEVLNARYVRLDDVTASNIKTKVKQLVA
jgi:magnesium chelatase subunit D